METWIKDQRSAPWGTKECALRNKVVFFEGQKRLRCYVCLQSNNCFPARKQLFVCRQTNQRSINCPSMEHRLSLDGVGTAPQWSMSRPSTAIIWPTLRVCWKNQIKPNKTRKNQLRYYYIGVLFCFILFSFVFYQTACGKQEPNVLFLIFIKRTRAWYVKIRVWIDFC
jgi:hypothetical protein